LIQPIGRSDEAVAIAEGGLARAVRAPVRYHRQRPGIELPVVMEWRGRIVVLARVDWPGVPRLRSSLIRIMNDDWVAVDIANIEGFESISTALSQAEYAVGVASELGYRGWVGDPGTIALETTFLLDGPLVRSAIEHELGGLLADARMGEELIETLAVYLGCGQNSREAARQLHLSPRTVSYRLERIEALLGRQLDTEAGLRLSAAIMEGDAPSRPGRVVDRGGGQRVVRVRMARGRASPRVGGITRGLAMIIARHWRWHIHLSEQNRGFPVARTAQPGPALAFGLDPGAAPKV
jgi:hypothetical protein